MLVLHGIFGRGTNWRSFASRLVRRCPSWGLVLVDLRMHGDSQAAPRPHTVAAAAADLAVLSDQLSLAGKPVRAVSGHSFGGKVALAYRATPAGRSLVRTFVLDASPSPSDQAMSAPGNTVVEVLRMQRSIPLRFASRREFVDHVVAQGFAPALGQWLAMNLVPAAPNDDSDGDGGLRSVLDPAAMESLLQDYYRYDAWPALASGPGVAHVVVAGGSDSVSQADQERLAALAESGAAVTTTVIPGASHWLHVDALAALIDVVAAGLPG